MSVRLTQREADAVALHLLDPCHVEWSESFPDDEASTPRSLRLDGRVLSFDEADGERVCARLIDAANAADEDAQRGRGVDFARDRDALTRAASKARSTLQR